MKKLKFIYFLFAVILTVGCSAQNTDIIGSYKSKEYSAINQAYLSYFKNTTFVLHSTLDLKADSTFHLVNCGNTEDGKFIRIVYCSFVKIINGIMIP